MRKDLEERWFQVHQRELRGIEKERELSKEARVAKVAISPTKAKAKKSRNELGMNGVHHVSAQLVARGPLSTGEPEADAIPRFRRDDGSMEEPDSGLKGSPLPRDLYLQDEQEQDSDVKISGRELKSHQKGRGEASRSPMLSIDGGPAGTRASKAFDKDVRRIVPSPRNQGKRGETSGPNLGSRSQNNI